jgi:hypothetical protein
MDILDLSNIVIVQLMLSMIQFHYLRTKLGTNLYKTLYIMVWTGYALHFTQDFTICYKNTMEALQQKTLSDISFQD